MAGNFKDAFEKAGYKNQDTNVRNNAPRSQQSSKPIPKVDLEDYTSKAEKVIQELKQDRNYRNLPHQRSGISFPWSMKFTMMYCWSRGKR